MRFPEIFLFGSVQRSQREQCKFNRVTVKLSIKTDIYFILLFFAAGPTYSAARERCYAVHQIMYGYDPVATRWWLPTQTKSTESTWQTQLWSHSLCNEPLSP